MYPKYLKQIARLRRDEGLTRDEARRCVQAEIEAARRRVLKAAGRGPQDEHCEKTASDNLADGRLSPNPHGVGITPTTPCGCSAPGFCPRHQVFKSAHLVKLCQTRRDYFDLWEAGRGPGQVIAKKPSSAETPATRGTGCGGCGQNRPPSLLAQAWNLSKAVATFVAGGLKTVDKEEYQRRLEICEGCDRRENQRCMECGCFLAVKAKGRVWTCPLGKWNPPTPEQTASQDELAAGRP